MTRVMLHLRRVASLYKGAKLHLGRIASLYKGSWQMGVMHLCTRAAGKWCHSGRWFGRDLGDAALGTDCVSVQVQLANGECIHSSAGVFAQMENASILHWCVSLPSWTTAVTWPMLHLGRIASLHAVVTAVQSEGGWGMRSTSSHPLQRPLPFWTMVRP